VRLLLVTQGQWGQRIADHICATAPGEWQVVTWQGPTALPIVIDEPDEHVPNALPQADLLVVLTESSGLTDLAPDLAQRCGARAVLLPVDRRSWAPRGLLGQVELAAPMPFCSLAPNDGQHPLIRAFAERYGRPTLTCATSGGVVASCEPLREAPCGNTRYIARRLPGVAVDMAVEQAGLLHHYYPCWGGMEADPVTGDHTLWQIIPHPRSSSGFKSWSSGW